MAKVTCVQINSYDEFLETMEALDLSVNMSKAGWISAVDKDGVHVYDWHGYHFEEFVDVTTRSHQGEFVKGSQ